MASTVTKKKAAPAKEAPAKAPTKPAKKKSAARAPKKIVEEEAVDDVNEEGDETSDDDEDEGGGGKSKALVVVESPAKAKTIKKYLGSGFTVKASVGHVMDLPKSKIGVDVDNDFAPIYEVIDAKKKVLFVRVGQDEPLFDASIDVISCGTLEAFNRFNDTKSDTHLEKV